MSLAVQCSFTSPNLCQLLWSAGNSQHCFRRRIKMPRRVKRDREWIGIPRISISVLLRSVVARQPLAGKSVCRLLLLSQAVCVCQTASAANMTLYSRLQTEEPHIQNLVCQLTNSNSDKHPHFKTGVNEKSSALNTMQHTIQTSKEQKVDVRQCANIFLLLFDSNILWQPRHRKESSTAVHNGVSGCQSHCEGQVSRAAKCGYSPQLIASQPYLFTVSTRPFNRISKTCIFFLGQP